MPGRSARRLTRRHRARLGAIADEIAAQVRDLASHADTADIDGWFASIVKDLMALLAAAWRAILELTGFYVEDHAAAEGRTVEPTFAEWNTEQVMTSLRVTGPVAFKKAIDNGQSEDEALDSMATQMAGAAEKIVLRADRDTVQATVDDSDEIVGWRRVSDGDPCAWCAMLLSRGAVYKSGRTAGDRRFGGNEYHDHDRCTAEPLYKREDEPPEVAALYQQWLKVTAGHSGDDALRVWRADWDALHQDVATQRKPSPAKEREPAPEPPADDRQQRARERQKEIDAARKRAEFLAELEEVAVINDARGDELARMARVAAKRFGVEDDPELARLLERAASGDPEMVAATLETLAKRLGLTRIGGDVEAEQVIKFDKRRHDVIPGEKATPFVEVVRPGYVAVIDGEELVVVHAKVAPTSKDPHRLKRDAEPARAKKPDVVDALLAKERALASFAATQPGYKAVRLRALEMLDEVLELLKGQTELAEDEDEIREWIEESAPEFVVALFRGFAVEAARATRATQRPEWHIDDLLLWDPFHAEKRYAETKRIVEEKLNGQYAGLTVKVTSIGSDLNILMIEARIFDADGRAVGEIERQLSRRIDPDGSVRIEAYHNLLKLNSSVQGQGFAEAWNSHLMEWYQDSGVEAVNVGANIDVGGYAWARQGFDFLDGGAAADVVSRLRWRITEHAARYDAGQLAAARKMLDRLRLDFDDPRFPSAYEVSQVGRKPGQGKNDFWPGKDAMLGSSWNGVKPVPKRVA